MSFIGDLFNPQKGAGYQAQGTNILQPTSVQDIQNANAAFNQAGQGYQGATQNALGAQAPSQQTLAQQQAFVNALAGQNGIQNQSNVFNQQQGLANQLQGISRGQGPNPAQAMLNQATGQNVSNQAALMAGQRGSGANAGLLARQTAQQGAATQQQAAGQGASLQAQQQLNALGALQGQQAQMAGLAGQQVGQLQSGLGMQGNLAQNQYQNALAQQQAAAQQQGIQQAQQQLMMNQANAQNQANIGMQSNINNVGAQIASGNQKAQQSGLGGVLGAVGSVLAAPFTGGASLAALPTALAGAHGGEVPGYADGGEVDSDEQQKAPAEKKSKGPQSFVGKSLVGISKALQTTGQELKGDQLQQAGQDLGKVLGQGLVQGGKALYNQVVGPGTPATDATMSNIVAKTPLLGGNPISQASLGVLPNQTNPLSPNLGAPALMRKGGPVVGAMLAAQGKTVPGKAKVNGDSLKNDFVDAKLSPGEIVIPRSISKSKNAPEKSAEFVRAILAKKRFGA